MAEGGAVILDTCALLWLVEGSTKLSRVAKRRIEDSPILCVSAVSGFEIALKVHSGKLELSKPVAVWIQEAIDYHGMTLLDLDLSTSIRTAGLPMIHSDPCDRFIIAAAKERGFPVVTSDERFPAYGIETLV